MSTPNTESPNAAQPQETIDTIDTLYGSSLLRYDTQLKHTSTLLMTIRAILHYVTPVERVSLLSLIQSTEFLHGDTRRELEDLLKRAEMLIQYECAKPNRIFERNNTREDVEQGLVSLGRQVMKLNIQADGLEEMRLPLLRRWGVNASTV